MWKRLFRVLGFGKSNSSKSINHDFDPLFEIRSNRGVANCPYCNFQFEKIPARKRKCPECKNEVYPRLIPGDSIKLLVTLEDKTKIEKFYKENQLIDKLQSQLVPEVISKSEFSKEVNSWRTSSSKVSANDFGWGLLHQILNEHATNIKMRKNIYRIMVWYLVDEGRNPNHALALFHRTELEELGENGLDFDVIVIAAPNSCMACQELSARRMSLEEAIRLQVLPCQECTHEYGYCRCSYGFVRPERN